MMRLTSTPVGGKGVGGRAPDSRRNWVGGVDGLGSLEYYYEESDRSGQKVLMMRLTSTPVGGKGVGGQVPPAPDSRRNWVGGVDGLGSSWSIIMRRVIGVDRWFK